jgi:hypothetical protein
MPDIRKRPWPLARRRFPVGIRTLGPRTAIRDKSQTTAARPEAGERPGTQATRGECQLPERLTPMITNLAALVNPRRTP